MTEQEARILVDTLIGSAHRGQKLNHIQSVVLRKTWAGRSYREIAEQLGYEHDYIRQIGSQLWRTLSQAVGEKVSKKNMQAVLCGYQQSQSGQQDWGEAIDVSIFYDRQAEVQTLKTWIATDRCRAIGVFGIGGIGKTALAVKLAQHLQSQFQYIIWRSLQAAPSLNSLLNEILPILTGTEIATDSSISTLMKQLHQKRCLLVLDNVESILQPSNRSGQYRSGDEEYRQLLERIADEPHQSCLVLTGREKPGGFTLREGEKLPVRSLQLSGLPVADSQKILSDKGLQIAESECQVLVNYLGGNPLALKIAASAIHEVFGGDIQAFLAQGNPVFSDLWDLLDRQFERLSPLQQQVMYQLAIAKEPIMLGAQSLTHLKEKFVPRVSGQELLEAVNSLRERSFIENERSPSETREPRIAQPPVIKEYVTARFIQTKTVTGSAC
jgi:hypothetical protein